LTNFRDSRLNNKRSDFPKYVTLYNLALIKNNKNKPPLSIEFWCLSFNYFGVFWASNAGNNFYGAKKRYRNDTPLKKP
jgi:hypothetical protein